MGACEGCTELHVSYVQNHCFAQEKPLHPFSFSRGTLQNTRWDTAHREFFATTTSEQESIRNIPTFLLIGPYIISWLCSRYHASRRVGLLTSHSTHDSLAALCSHNAAFFVWIKSLFMRNLCEPSRFVN